MEQTRSTKNSSHLLKLILTLLTLIWTLVKVWLHSTIACHFKNGLMSLGRILQRFVHWYHHEYEYGKDHNEKAKRSI